MIGGPSFAARGRVGAAGAAGPAGNTEKGYAESAAAPATALTAMQDVVPLQINFVAGARPVVVEADLRLKHSAAGGIVVAEIQESRNGGAYATIQQIFWTAGVANALGSGTIKARRPVVQGDTYAYKVRFCTFQFGTAGTSTLNGGASSPNSIQANEV